MTKEDGGQAFPYGDPTHGGSEGMTLRDYFAAAALQGYMANPTSFGPEVPETAKSDPFLVAQIGAGFAYLIAAAMLDERAK